jgi:hypothetical protein
LSSCTTDWPATNPARLGESLHDFVGSSAYDLGALRTDLKKFTFLLGAADGNGLFILEAE